MRAVLTYHSIDDSGSPISMPAAALERQLRWLASGRVKVVSLGDLIRLPTDADAAAVTFDDGFENFSTRAAPLLIALALPATVFVVTGRVGSTNAWAGHPTSGIPTLPLLGWPTIERLFKSGIAIGAHSRTHRDLTRLDPAELDDEIFGSADDCRSKLGVAPDAFAYPFGRVNREAAERVSAGFACGCTTELRALRGADAAAMLPRLDMYYFQRSERLEAWGTPTFDRHLAVRRQARRARALLDGGLWKGKRTG